MVDVKTINAWTARIIPALLIGLGVYGAYVVIGQIGVIYLLAPQQNGFLHVQPRPGTAIAIIVIFSVLIFFFACTYFRLILTIIVNPGYVPLSQGYYDYQSQLRKQSTRSHRSRGSRDAEKRNGGVGGPPYEQAISTNRPSPANEQPGLSNFYNKDVFICEGDGRPPWCSVCLDWKPDRSHHCREVQRCVRKMDHFCPWVGGIVSETNFKFFLQFNFYTFLVCIFLGVVIAYYLAEQIQNGLGTNIHFPIALGLVVLFGLFCGGMTIMSVRYAVLNLTSIEVLSDSVKVWTLAVYLPNPPPPNVHPPYQTITFPLVIDANTNPPPPQRTFAILHSKPGESPFDLGMFENWKSVMGYTIWDWSLPLRYSPCCDHTSGESDYQMGPVFKLMKERAGILPAGDTDEKRHRRKHRRRSSQHRRYEKDRPKDSQEVHLQKPTSDHPDDPIEDHAEDPGEEQTEEQPMEQPAEQPAEHSANDYAGFLAGANQNLGGQSSDEERHDHEATENEDRQQHSQA